MQPVRDVRSAQMHTQVRTNWMPMDQVIGGVHPEEPCSRFPAERRPLARDPEGLLRRLFNGLAARRRDGQEARRGRRGTHDDMLVVLGMSRAHVLTLVIEGRERESAGGSRPRTDDPRPSAAYR